MRHPDNQRWLSIERCLFAFEALYRPVAVADHLGAT